MGKYLGTISMVTGCVSSRLVHECEGEAECGFYGLPHVLCVPVPPYAQFRDNDAGSLHTDIGADALTVAPEMHTER